ncbi:hypothetical protein [Sphingomonas sp.]|uniref:hypothetical protein n=1 Tax=Sphingomonas sp. TaxID=28214 RepID=UPI000DB4CFBE|nr:hypothetical protein [Sphingomonas sp.]PZU06993.1 MAG: hypothetical protein DI605_16695 [Sphingomonas sp.]
MMPTLHMIQSTLLGWMHRYHDAALWIERNGPASDKLLHMNAGLILWLATVLLRGRSWGDKRNLLPLVLLETLNEVADYLFPYRWTLSGTIADLFWTFFWPFLLAFLIGGRGTTGRRR